MPHPRRVFPAGTSAHIYQRALNGGVVFADTDDFGTFLAFVREYTVDTAVRVHGFGVMNTHYHLLATPDAADAIPRAMQRIDGAYTKYFNKKHARSGTIWGGRYKAKIIEDDRYWLTALRYIELNPVAAGIVDGAAEYRWSSFLAHAAGASTWLASHPIYDALGSTPEERQAKYRLACACGVPQEFELP
ncbi:MAG TPA: transposase [Vicinamibacterales bacterium]|nr:transposase [Vicinamibacterales bacterium]